MSRSRTNDPARWMVAVSGVLATAGFWAAIVGSPAAGSGEPAQVAVAQATPPPRTQRQESGLNELSTVRRSARRQGALAARDPAASPSTQPQESALVPRLRTRGS
jgi:hypothetical protein